MKQFENTYIKVGMEVEVWKVPAKVVVDKYLSYFPNADEDEVYEELLDFAQNSMDWKDVEGHAVLVESYVDRDTDWVNSYMTLEEEGRLHSESGLQEIAEESVDVLLNSSDKDLNDFEEV